MYSKRCQIKSTCICIIDWHHHHLSASPCMAQAKSNAGTLVRRAASQTPATVRAPTPRVFPKRYAAPIARHRASVGCRSRNVSRVWMASTA